MLTLNRLRPTRVSKGFKRSHLADLTGVEDQRLRALELREAEPWFDEAAIISKALMVDNIAALVTSGSLTSADLGVESAVDIHVWRSGARVPLSLACRLAKTFGLTDPIELSSRALDRQIWEIIAANDRHPEYAGICPWCVADIGLGEAHLLTCLPNNLYGPRDIAHEGVTLFPDKKAVRTKAIPAKNLKAPRLDHSMSQAQVAEVLGINVNYYARIERGDVPLQVAHADVLARYYDADRATLYAAPNPE